MTGKEKRILVEKIMESGDRRSFNELMADLELQIWTEKHKGAEYVKQKMGARLVYSYTNNE
jgi:hypothetical protein